MRSRHCLGLFVGSFKNHKSGMQADCTAFTDKFCSHMAVAGL